MRTLWKKVSSLAFELTDSVYYLDPPYYGCENYYGDGIEGGFWKVK
jgi:hypothetical protein